MYQRGVGVWDPKVCVPKIVRSNLSRSTGLLLDPLQRGAGIGLRPLISIQRPVSPDVPIRHSRRIGRQAAAVLRGGRAATGTKGGGLRAEFPSLFPLLRAITQPSASKRVSDVDLRDGGRDWVMEREPGPGNRDRRLLPKLSHLGSGLTRQLQHTAMSAREPLSEGTPRRSNVAYAKRHSCSPMCQSFFCFCAGSCRLHTSGPREYLFQRETDWSPSRICLAVCVCVCLCVCARAAVHRVHRGEE